MLKSIIRFFNGKKCPTIRTIKTPEEEAMVQARISAHRELIQKALEQYE